MAGRDMSLAAFEDRKRKQNEMKKKQKNRKEARKNCVQIAEFEDYCISDSQDDLSSEECSNEAPCPSKKKALEKKINSKQIVTSEVATVLDRVIVSDRKATMVIAAVTKHLCNELEEVTLSRSTVRRARKSNRQNYALQKRNDFVSTARLLLHWDGKMLPGLTRVHAD